MTQLYLSRLNVQEFRSFGHLDVSLAEGPGVLIVYGSNGLGKSSLFDGLEWALTGTIDHYPEAKKNIPESQYLRRWDAPPDRPTQIRLEFNQGWIGRDIGRGLDAGGEQDLVGFFRDKSWQNPIEHLDRYFLLTHFLGQSTVSRMTHRDDKERWEFLQEPAQSERSKEIVRLLHGHAASTPALAFRRSADRQLKQAQQLQTLLDQEEGAWNAAQMEGAADDVAAIGEATAIAADVRLAMRGLGLPDLPDFKITLGEIPEGLESLQTTADAALSTRIIQLERAGDIERHHALAAAAYAAIVVELTKTEERVRATESLASTAKTEAVKASQVLLASREELAHARLAAQALARLATARNECARLRSNLEASRRVGESLHQEAKAADRRVERAERRRRLAEKLSERERQAAAETERLLGRRVAVEAAMYALGARDAAQAALNAELELHPALESDLVAVTKELERASQRVTEVSATLATARQVSDAMSAALSEVAGHLRDDACDCPLCGTKFHPAELQDRARAAANRLAPTLVPLQERVTEAERDRDAIQKNWTILSRAKVARNSAQTNLDLCSAELAAASDAIPASGVLADWILTNILAETESSHEIALARRRRATHWLNHPAIGGNAAALSEWADSLGHSNRLASLEEAQRHTIGECEASLNRSEATLANAMHEAGISVEAKDSEIIVARAAAETRERIAESSEIAASFAAERAVADLATTEANLAAIKELVEQHRAKKREYDRQSIARTEEWAGMRVGSAEIGAEPVRRATSALAAERARLAGTRVRIDKLRQGRVAWMRQGQQRAALNTLRDELGAAPVADRNSVRAAALKIQANYLAQAKAIQRAKSIAQDAWTEVTKRVQEFNRENLRPLNRLMNQINRSILSDEAIGLDLEVKHDSIEQRAIATDAPPYVSELNPLFVHSEGQMAALAVSMLTAANLTFPWSRWPALIMDDPLQHNDVIHAAAFADMIRNLVQERGYQIFLSTHDLAEAQFLRRKFRAASLPCTMVHLTGQGRNGVECRVDRMPATYSTAV